MSRVSLKNDFKDGEILYGAQLNTNNNATIEAVNDNYERIMNLQDLKADVVDVTNQLATKVDNNTFNNAIDSLNTTKADKSALNLKADKTELATKADTSYVNGQLATKADTNYVNSQLSTKADTSYVNNQLALKADKADTYTKEETTSAINSAITGKADTSYVNNQLATKANASDLGNLSQLQTNDKTSAVAAINEVLNEGSKIKNIDNLSITSNENNEIQTVGVIDVNNNTSAVKTWTGTKEEYNALEVKNSNTLYYITDDYEEPEVVSNKVNTIDASSTNEQYPSAKAVYDSIQGIAPGGSNDYNDLNNKPQINGITLQGNLSNSDLGIKQTYTANDIAFTDGETFQQKFDSGELIGPKGDTGAQGPAGTDGNDATINGQNAINLVAGENINIAQDGANVTISSTGSSGGATYTAGTNIEITEDGVINNTIPYKNNDTGIQLGTSTYPNHTVDNGTVAIGYPTTFIGNLSSAVSIGGTNTIANASVALGVRANVNYVNSIGIGYFAKVNKTNQFVLGSTVAPINEMKVVTSDGDKYIATTDLIDALVTRIETLEEKVNALEGGA